jgi:hypothetical protein
MNRARAFDWAQLLAATIFLLTIFGLVFAYKTSIYNECRQTHSSLYCFHEVSR